MKLLKIKKKILKQKVEKTLKKSWKNFLKNWKNFKLLKRIEETECTRSLYFDYCPTDWVDTGLTEKCSPVGYLINWLIQWDYARETQPTHLFRNLQRTPPQTRAIFKMNLTCLPPGHLIIADSSILNTNYSFMIYLI